MLVIFDFVPSARAYSIATAFRGQRVVIAKWAFLWETLGLLSKRGPRSRASGSRLAQIILIWHVQPLVRSWFYMVHAWPAHTCENHVHRSRFARTSIRFCRNLAFVTVIMYRVICAKGVIIEERISQFH